jgi:hypothetical protein
MSGRREEVAAKLARVRGWLDDSGYDAVCGRDVPGTEAAAATIAAGTAFAWNPTVRGAKSEDTFIAGGDGLRVAVSLTNTADWPVVSGGRPAILPI